ncbi:hypothetical protein AFE02nite_17010 [Actinotalea fermentans]|uniref:Methylamine utilisation protein MauE domain-containing protein n=1 Tax=Actinotalea fermentans TaxID=43671 RepID=A0A511YXP4_9CELL|nr:hypothetical protein AFE02nite_17010 [Actinotalea fermentans]
MALYAGAIKLGDLDESVWAVRAYDLLPDGVADVVGHVLPFAEVLLGLLLITGLATRWAAAGFGLLLVAFTIGIASAWARGLAIDCGCFGGGGPVDPAETNYLPDLLRDLGLLVLAALLTWWPTSRLSLDGALHPAVLDRDLSDTSDTLFDHTLDHTDDAGANAPGRSSDVPD